MKSLRLSSSNRARCVRGFEKHDMSCRESASRYSADTALATLASVKTDSENTSGLWKRRRFLFACHSIKTRKMKLLI
jgi:hypothetical protein